MKGALPRWPACTYPCSLRPRKALRRWRSSAQTIIIIQPQYVCWAETASGPPCASPLACRVRLLLTVCWRQHTGCSLPSYLPAPIPAPIPSLLDPLLAPADWDGGLILVSHDFRLISQVANEIWVVDKGTVSKWNGDIVSYKAHLRASHAALTKRDDLA